MNRNFRESLLNVVVLGTVLSVTTLVYAANNNWHISDLISFQQSDVQEPARELAQADAEVLQTPLPTVPPQPSGPCPCAPPPTPSPTPFDPDVPPTPTPTPDTSNAPPPFTITLNSFY